MDEINWLATASDFDDELIGDELRNAALLQLSIEKETLEGSLHDFVRAAWHLVEPNHPFQDNWHIRKLCKHLEHVFYKSGPFRDGLVQDSPKKPRRSVINIPPGMMKSLIVMVFFPAWCWAKNPRLRFLCASYGSTLSNRDNLRCRQIIESPWYQERWPIRLMDDQNTKTRYNTTENGWRIATSVGGPGTGEHPDFILIDDPHSAEEARSDAERNRALIWFDGTIATRLGRNPAIVLIMQRLHADDLSGHLLKRGGWYHVRYPMRYERCTCPEVAPRCHPNEELRCSLHKSDPTWAHDPTDERTEAGALLFPSFCPEEKVRGLEVDLGAYGAAGQLQQRPAPEGGGQFKREWFKFVDAKPALARRCRGWDTAGTKDGGDWTVGVLISEEFDWVLTPAAGLQRAKRELKSTGRFFVESVVRDQLDPAGVDGLMKVTAELDGKEVPIREEREGGSSGKGQIAAHGRLLAGWDYKEVQLGADKITRAKPFRAQCELGNVYLVRAAWNEAYISELTGFPTGSHDDQVDGSSCSFNSLLLEPPPKTVKLTW